MLLGLREMWLLRMEMLRCGLPYKVVVGRQVLGDHRDDVCVCVLHGAEHPSLLREPGGF